MTRGSTCWKNAPSTPVPWFYYVIMFHLRLGTAWPARSHVNISLDPKCVGMRPVCQLCLSENKFLSYIISLPQSPLSSQSLPLAPISPDPLSMLPFRKKMQAFQDYQPRMVYHVSLRLGITPYIKAGQGNPAGGKGSQSRQKDQRQLLLPVRYPTRTPRYTNITYMQRA